MERHVSDSQLLSLRQPLLVWLLLLNFCCSLLPPIALAQSMSATIRSLSGNVIVSGQKARVGTVLRSGDSIQTWRDSSAVLRLSDGSVIQLGENTRINIDDLSRTPSGGRRSAFTAIVGWIRATLSPEHQRADSSFRVDTPNAQIGARFSQPDFAVYVSPDQEETWAMAHTIELEVTNRLSGEAVIVPVGSSAIVKGMLIQVFPRILDPVSGPDSGSGSEEQQPPSGGETGGGMGTGTKILIGAGALAAAGGAAAVAIIKNNEENEDDDDDLEATGKCDELQTSGSDAPETHVIELGKRSGTFLLEYQTYSVEDRITVEYEGQLLFDSGCVGTDYWRSQRISYSGKTSKITLNVIPNCSGTYGTYWEFVVYCP